MRQLPSPLQRRLRFGIVLLATIALRAHAKSVTYDEPQVVKCNGDQNVTFPRSQTDYEVIVESENFPTKRYPNTSCSVTIVPPNNDTAIFVVFEYVALAIDDRLIYGNEGGRELFLSGTSWEDAGNANLYYPPQQRLGQPLTLRLDVKNSSWTAIGFKAHVFVYVETDDAPSKATRTWTSSSSQSASSFLLVTPGFPYQPKSEVNEIFVTNISFTPTRTLLNYAAGATSGSLTSFNLGNSSSGTPSSICNLIGQGDPCTLNVTSPIRVDSEWAQDGIIINYGRNQGQLLDAILVIQSGSTTNGTCENSTPNGRIDLTTDNSTRLWIGGGDGGLYSNGMNCTWDLQSPNDTAIAVWIDYLQTEKCCDLLRFNAINSQNSILNSLNGGIRDESGESYGTPEAFTRLVDSNNLDVTFTSDSAIGGIGAQLRFQALPLTIPGTDNGAVAAIDTEGQSYSTPGYPVGYGSNLSWTWVFRAKNASKYLQLTFPGATFNAAAETSARLVSTSSCRNDDPVTWTTRSRSADSTYASCANGTLTVLFSSTEGLVTPDPNSEQAGFRFFVSQIDPADYHPVTHGPNGLNTTTTRPPGQNSATSTVLSIVMLLAVISLVF